MATPITLTDPRPSLGRICIGPGCINIPHLASECDRLAGLIRPRRACECCDLPWGPEHEGCGSIQTDGSWRGARALRWAFDSSIDAEREIRYSA